MVSLADGPVCFFRVLMPSRHHHPGEPPSLWIDLIHASISDGDVEAGQSV